MLAFFLVEKYDIMLLTYEKMEEKFCFIHEASLDIVDKQLLIELSNSRVVSRNRTFLLGCHRWC